MLINKKIDFDVSERPISTVKEDCFDVEPRIVNKIYGFIQDLSTVQLTIAITGEWGIGKSSVINLLLNKLKGDKKNIILTFEPLLEGKFEASDIMSLFYLKLYQNLTNTTVRNVIKSCFKSAAILSRAKFTGSAELDASAVGVSGVKVGGKVEYNLGENIDALLALWDKEKPQTFSDQTKELNKSLKDHGYRLYIVMDEIDRLPAEYIIQLLLFCRVLESFDNLICIVGIDYEKVINKLMKESLLCLDGYEEAQSYLDKLFQAKFHVNHNKYKIIEYGKSRLVELDHQNVLDQILGSTDYKVQAGLEGIFSYLSTPRQIKKWLISLKVNYPILKYSPDKIAFMAFLAAAVKHPIVIDYISRHTLKLLAEKLFLSSSINKRYGVDFSQHKDVDAHIILASLGFRGSFRKNDDALRALLGDFIKELKVQSIEDRLASEYLTQYLKSPRYLIALFVEGFASEDKVGLYDDFFGGQINNAIESIMDNDSNIYMLVSDLAETLQKGYESIKGMPQIPLLDKLWKNKINDDNFFGNPYEVIILFCLRKLPIEQVISDSCVAMSEAHVSRILLACGIKNHKEGDREGVYSLEHFQLPSESDVMHKGMQDLQFKGISLANFTQATINDILKCWIEKVETALESKQVLVYAQPALISVFYRYVQWALMLKMDNRDKLANLIIDYLDDSGIKKADKQSVRAIIRKEQEKFESQKMGMKENPMETLFNGIPRLIELMQSDN